MEYTQTRKSIGYASSRQADIEYRIAAAMSLKTLIILLFGFAIYLRSSAKFCVTKYVNGKWISTGDCGGSGRMSEMQKELQRKIKDERKKCVAGEEWTVFQRRINGDVDFYRGWDDYKKGFGDCDGDLWLGLEELHNRTKEGDMELEINMITKDKGIHWVAKYSSFSIGPGSDFYRLRVSGYSGNATRDLLAHNNNRQFSTKDSVHDSGHRCASAHEGGWWYGSWSYSSCSVINLNGNFHKTGGEGIRWYTDLLRFTEMKFRERAGN